MAERGRRAEGCYTELSESIDSLINSIDSLCLGFVRVISFGHNENHFRSFLGHFWVISGSFLGHFWVIFGSFLGHFWVIFGSFLGHFWVIFGSFLGHFGIIFGSFLGHFQFDLWLVIGQIKKEKT